MKICHPDKMIMQDLDEDEFYKRKLALKLCTEAYPAEDFNLLVFAASLVDVYVAGISEKEYLDGLNNLYSEYSKNITTLQNTMEWLWGTNWDTLESRYRIVEAVCISKGIAIPSKIQVIEKLVEHELS